jgi:hypothetical protein
MKTIENLHTMSMKEMDAYKHDCEVIDVKFHEENNYKCRYHLLYRLSENAYKYHLLKINHPKN